MIHPSTERKWIDSERGYGLFAREDIPMGTITYVRCQLDAVLEANDPLLSDPLYAQAVKKYSYTDTRGDRVLSWDDAKYMNHSCQANTLTTGYGFEICVRDIARGEEITDDYGLFYTGHEMNHLCDQLPCRHSIVPGDFDSLRYFWDEKIKIALQYYKNVSQPLERYLDAETLNQLNMFLNEGFGYLSVREQKPHFKLKTSVF